MAVSWATSQRQLHVTGGVAGTCGLSQLPLEYFDQDVWPWWRRGCTLRNRTEGTSQGGLQGGCASCRAGSD